MKGTAQFRLQLSQPGRSIWLLLLLLGMGVSTPGIAPSLAQTPSFEDQFNVPLYEENQTRNEADLLVQLGQEARTEGDLNQAIAYWREAIERYEDVRDLEGLGIVYDYLGSTYLALNDFERAEDALRRRLGVARSRRNYQAQIYALNNLGTILLGRGNAGGAATLFQEALELARRVGNRQGEGLSLNNLGLASSALQNYRQAIEFYEAAVSIRRRIRDSRSQANTLNNLADAYLRAGNYQNALSNYNRALTIAQAYDDSETQIRAVGGLAKSLVGQEQVKPALRRLGDWITLARESGNLSQELQAVRLSAQLYAALGNKAEAVRFYEQAIAIAQTIGDDQVETFLVNELSQLIYDNSFGEGSEG